jgi:CDGSH-type Zn-finger protein
MSRAAEREVEITVCGDGPALVRGAGAIRDSDGTVHPVTRPVVGVCLCGRTQRRPWCDGTHKFVRKDKPDKG